MRANRKQNQGKTKAKLGKSKERQNTPRRKLKAAHDKHLAPFWAILEPSWNRHGTSLAILEQFWNDLSASWPDLPIFGLSWISLEQFWRFLDPFMCILWSSWGRLGLFWGHLGSILIHSGAILSHLRTILGSSGAILGLSWGCFGLLGAILGHLGSILGPRAF